MGEQRGIKMLGDFAEWHDGRTDGLPSIRGAVNRGPGQPDQRRLAFYLVQGTIVRSTMGMTADVLDGEPVYLSESLLSDGAWVWRADLAHYVVKYNIAVSPTFIEHAASYQWSPGVLTEGEAIEVSRQIRAE